VLLHSEFNNNSFTLSKDQSRRDPNKYIMAAHVGLQEERVQACLSRERVLVKNNFTERKEL